MLHRSHFTHLHHHTDADNAPIHRYSPFGWHYLNPGGIDRPRLHNRNFGRVWHGHAITGEQNFRLNMRTLLHPALQIALQPFLSLVNKAVSEHRGDETESDMGVLLTHYRSLKDILPHRERDVVFSAVVNACRDPKTFAEAKKLWEADCHDLYVSTWDNVKNPVHSSDHVDMCNIKALTNYCQNLLDPESNTSFPESSFNKMQKNIPPLPLAEAFLHSAAKACDPIWKQVFQLSKKDFWNTSPHYSGQLWSAVLYAAGELKDEVGAIAVIEEILDCNVHLPTISAEHIVTAINSVQSENEYNKLKKLLSFFPTRVITSMRHRYVELRNAEKIPQNDKIFYHVHWLFHIRKPMHFLPRRLYFDYKPTTSKSESITQKKGIKDVMKQRIEMWKKDGTLPQDYNEDSFNVSNRIDKTIDRMKKEAWKKRTPSPGQSLS